MLMSFHTNCVPFSPFYIYRSENFLSVCTKTFPTVSLQNRLRQNSFFNIHKRIDSDFTGISLLRALSQPIKKCSVLLFKVMYGLTL